MGISNSSAWAQNSSEDADFGAIHVVKSVNPYVIELTLEPKAAFTSIIIETPNVTASNKTACAIASPIVGQKYFCN